jgi:DNA-binding MarR family transcriptional regulator
MSERKALSEKAASEAEDPVAEHVRWVVENWPEIDPDVQGIVNRVDKINRYVQDTFRSSLGEANLTTEEWKVLIALHGGVRSHGWLCRDLDVSTGAMTNRLDKLERGGLVRRAPDPNDRRGVLLELTRAGADRMEEYVIISARQESELLAGLDPAERHQLNELLSKLLISMRANDTSPRGRGRNA